MTIAAAPTKELQKLHRDLIRLRHDAERREHNKAHSEIVNTLAMIEAELTKRGEKP